MLYFLRADPLAPTPHWARADLLAWTPHGASRADAISLGRLA
jgi:hypothetical protein